MQVHVAQHAMGCCVSSELPDSYQLTLRVFSSNSLTTSWLACTAAACLAASAAWPSKKGFHDASLPNSDSTVALQRPTECVRCKIQHRDTGTAQGVSQRLSLRLLLCLWRNWLC
jgi:hypothetical protein